MGEIIGVVGNVRDAGPDQPPPLVIFWPMAVANIWDMDLRVQRSMAFAVRTSRPTATSLLPEVRA